jgi:hypothetical protein
MQLLPLDKLGGRVVARRLEFGVLLPGVAPDTGFAVAVRVIHERDQFLQDVPPLEVALNPCRRSALRRRVERRRRSRHSPAGRRTLVGT